MVKLGVDQAASYQHWLKDGRVGLLTSVSGRNSQNISTAMVLKDICYFTALFAPEHGIRGNADAGAGVDNEIDPGTGLPVYSLYGGTGKHFTPEQLDLFDILVYDIQDVGVRFFTFISSLRNALEDCGKAGKRLAILDRPNPLGGTVVEGGLLDMAYQSFVGCYPLPVRYGLTCGETAHMMNEESGFDCDLRVVPIEGWQRDSLFCHWGKVWLPPSSGLPTFETALLYPGLCLIEGTNLSEGRGTSAPFRMIGAPYVDAEALTKAFSQANLPGVAATPAWFKPMASKHQGEPCSGILLHVVDPNLLRPVTVGITLMDILRNMYPKDFAYLPPYREGGRPFITLLSGGGQLLDHWDRDDLLRHYGEDSAAFTQRKQRFHLYD